MSSKNFLSVTKASLQPVEKDQKKVNIQVLCQVLET